MITATAKVPYIEILGSFSKRRLELHPWNLQARGEFTRENIQWWLERDSRTIIEPLETDIVGDFHAVCGDIDIPWATEEARLVWEKVCGKPTIREKQLPLNLDDWCQHDWRARHPGRLPRRG